MLLAIAALSASTVGLVCCLLEGLGHWLPGRAPRASADLDCSPRPPLTSPDNAMLVPLLPLQEMVVFLSPDSREASGLRVSLCVLERKPKQVLAVSSVKAPIMSALGNPADSTPVPAC